ncbi:polysaccharide deacetylase family protein [Parapedobacter deserti]|uniref:Polysaccharide deacetylase family protein n=1 Tax=Parapedobacter deserti TaxID=1912957 RepID=A0ABV7JQ01_9SPHI
MNIKQILLLLSILFALTAVLVVSSALPWLVMLILPIAGLTILVFGAFSIRWNFFLKAIHCGDTTRRQIALTFDDGPHPDHTPRVLAQLREYGIRATFFCIGQHVEQHPELMQRIHDEGHLVGNHSFTHASTIDFHGKAKWLAEIRQTDEAIEHAIGKRPQFFRPPYGVTTPHLAKAVRESGHHVIGWRVRPYDTVARPSQRITKKILKKTRSGDIILLHDTHDRIIPVLEQLLPELKKLDFSLVTVEKLIQQQAYAKP